MKKGLIIIAIIISILTSLKSKDNNNVVIPEDSIRFRIISNSDNKIDIAKKIYLKNILEKYLFNLIKDSKSKEETNNVIVNNLENLNNIVNKNIENTSFEIKYGKNYFPSKIYNGVIYNEGIYDSLVITLGEGKGTNWWCLLFPPLCLLEDNETTNNVEYKFYVSRIINEFK